MYNLYQIAQSITFTYSRKKGVETVFDKMATIEKKIKLSINYGKKIKFSVKKLFTKGLIIGLRQFLAIENPLKRMKNAP